jgi:hypothetical protein
LSNPQDILGLKALENVSCGKALPLSNLAWKKLFSGQAEKTELGVRDAGALSYVSISEASRRWSVSRQTVYNYLNEGKLSCTEDAQGNKQIAVTDLVAVLGEPKQQTESRTAKDESTAKASQGLASKLAHELDIERLKREGAERRTDDLEKQIYSLQSQIDRLHQRDADRDRQIEAALKTVSDSLRLLSAPVAPNGNHAPKKSLIEKLMNWQSS